MIKRIFLLLFLLLAFQAAFAQQPITAAQRFATLRAEADAMPESPEKVDKLLQIIRFYLDSQPDTALVLLSKTEAMTTKIGYIKGQFVCASSRGIWLGLSGRYREAIVAYQAAFELAKAHNMQKEMLLVEGDIANMYSVLGERKIAIEQYKSIKQKFTVLNDTVQISNGYFNLCRMYMEDKPDSAIAMIEIAIQLLEKQGRSDDRLGVYYGILGACLLAKGDTKLCIGNELKAIQLLRKSNNLYTLSDVYIAISKAYFLRKEGENAHKYALKALETAEAIHYPLNIAQAHLGIGEALSLLKKDEAGLASMEKAESISIEIGAKDLLKNTYQSMEVVAKGMHKRKLAAQYRKKYEEIDTDTGQKDAPAPK